MRASQLMWRRCRCSTRKADFSVRNTGALSQLWLFFTNSFANESHCTRAPKRRTFATSFSYDPLARRPNKTCDPYGQGGKPLSREEAQNLLATVEDSWRLVPAEATNEPPTGLTRDFFHNDFLTASQFVTKIAAVATVNNHYPSILLERRLLPKAWQVVTRVECRTLTLEGLSYNDFHIAMVSFCIAACMAVSSRVSARQFSLYLATCLH